MEFSKDHEMDQSTKGIETADSSAAKLDGHALVSEVVQHTGISGSLIESELTSIIETAGHETSTLTLDQLRAAMLAYLETLNVDMAEEEEEAARSEVGSTSI